MLVNLKEILQDAKSRNYGVGMFNTFGIEMAKGVLEAAEETGSPVIFGSAEVLLPCCDLETLATFLIPMAKKASVPVVVHLDHGYTEKIIKKAVDLGFTSVMYDCSALPFEENARNCARIAAYAHAFGASVEGELGHVAFDGEKGDNYTQPEQVEKFVELTDVDALAVAIGTEHGVYKSKPVLDIERLKEIRAVTDRALVLHGGSGLSLKDLQSCIKNGIQKVNIYTDISMAACDSAHEYVEKKGRNIEGMSVFMKDAIKKVAMQKMIDFGSSGMGK